MTEIVEIPVADLIFDNRNARLTSEQPNEQATILSLATQQGAELLRLAKDIVENGLDPTALPIVVPTEDQKKRYIVLEGNRRLLALRALDTPSLVLPAFNALGQKTMNGLARRYAKNPTESVRCALCDSEEEANHWITLRHTGKNRGIGLVEWGADEKDRWAARHGTRSPEGQIIDFVEKHLDEVTEKPKRILTSLRRLINTPRVREVLGIEKEGGQILSLYPTSEVAKGLSRIVDDLTTGRIKVGDIYTSPKRIKYIESLTTKDLPDPSSRLDIPLQLDGLNESVPKSKTKAKKKKKRQQRERTTVIPKSCQLDIDSPRINYIYNELMTLNVSKYPNACSVTLRVFLELSVDHYIEQYKLMTDTKRRETNLAKRLKKVVADLEKKRKIGKKLAVAVEKISDSKFVIAASTATFNQYVHNQYVFPKPNELMAAWDELQPFHEALWP